MFYCKECGNMLDDDAKFCQRCGKKIEISEFNKIENNNSTQSTLDNDTNNMIINTLKCPNCGSTDINTQVVTENKPTGCLTIFIYIFLALTIIGIPIMLLILVARGKKTSTKTIFVCQNCGKTFNKSNITQYSFEKKSLYSSNKQELSTEKIILLIVAIFLFIIFIGVAIHESSDKPVSDVTVTYYLGETVNFKNFSVKVDNCQIKYQNQAIDNYYVISDPEWIAVTFTYTNISEKQNYFSRYKTRIINSRGEIIKPSTLYYRIWDVDYLENTQLLPNGSKTGFLQFSNTVKDKADDLTLQISTSSSFEKTNTFNFKLTNKK